ncbi:hypothetical protein E2562_015202 [Oryza meyeriana var. granulata]|uniref:Myb-like domain-containing protein n=1 Tax=Oryza meyeriana var. granulata TaxID=110450 RepID=A0A6G1EX02_9ORYZ|nr:hypothetical protein E2562_015202 [Oryza meyeriana var. granulata]
MTRAATTAATASFRLRRPQRLPASGCDVDRDCNEGCDGDRDLLASGCDGRDGYRLSAATRAASYAPFKPPQPIDNPTAVEEISTPDSGDDLPRTEKRIIWTQEEDVRLMSSWLYNSTDPSIGADRKNEQYWNDVVETYNETIPSHRRRNAKQAKDRWHKMWIEKAHTFYIKDNEELKLGYFILMNVWYAVRDEAKWITYNKGLKQARKRNKSDNGANEGETEADLEEVKELPRPMGQKKAKKAAQDKKGKAKVFDSDVEELNTFGKLQSEEHANRLKVLEVQQNLSSEKLEQAKLAHLAAKEQKEAAKEQKELRMFETYNRLLSQDVGTMSDEEKTDHAAILKNRWNRHSNLSMLPEEGLALDQGLGSAAASEDLEAPDEALGADLEELQDFDSSEVYSIDDFIAEDEKLESFRRKIGEKLKAKMEG